VRPPPARTRSKPSLVRLRAEGFDLLLELKLLELQFLQLGGVGGRPIRFFLDHPIQILVTEAKFTDTGFDGHDVSSPCRTTVTASDHPLVWPVRSHMCAVGWTAPTP